MKFILFIVLLISFDNMAFSQTTKADLILLKNQQSKKVLEESYYEGNYNNQKLISIKKKRIFFKFNPFILLSAGSLWVYQNVLSPQLSRECPYEITCSNFSKHAIDENGLIKGVFITADRLMRCNPISLADLNEENLDPKTQKIIDFPCWYK